MSCLRKGVSGAFILALEKLIAACGLENLKMSDYGILQEYIPALARTSRETMGVLFGFDRYPLSFDDTVKIFEKAFR